VSGSGELWVVVGSGGVGKTTLAAALGVASARQGVDTLVMTFDPSLRLKDALGVGEGARDGEVEVESAGAGRLAASLLDAGRTFDRLVDRYAPDEEARDRILSNRFYRELSGSLAGVLEYMAVERLFEVAEERRWRRVVLDTPPTRQALDFLGAPGRIVGFLESGVLDIAMRPWFDENGRLRVASRLGSLGRGIEHLLDRVVGLELLRDMSEFFRAFGPLYDGFRERAGEVERLLRDRATTFLLVGGPGSERIPDTLFFARKLVESGHRLGPVVVNRVHPPPPHGGSGASGAGDRLLDWLGERDREGLAELARLLPAGRGPVSVPLRPAEPADLDALAAMGADLLRKWGDAAP